MIQLENLNSGHVNAINLVIIIVKKGMSIDIVNRLPELRGFAPTPKYLVPSLLLRRRKLGGMSLNSFRTSVDVGGSQCRSKCRARHSMGRSAGFALNAKGGSPGSSRISSQLLIWEYPVGGPRRSEASELALVVFSVSDSSSSSSTNPGFPNNGNGKAML